MQITNLFLSFFSLSAGKSRPSKVWSYYPILHYGAGDTSYGTKEQSLYRRIGSSPAIKNYLLQTLSSVPPGGMSDGVQILKSLIGAGLRSDLDADRKAVVTISRHVQTTKTFLSLSAGKSRPFKVLVLLSDSTLWCWQALHYRRAMGASSKLPRLSGRTFCL